MQWNKGTDKNEPEPIKEFRGRGWFNIWGVLLLLFVGLLGMCGYWIMSLGLWGALDNNQFAYAAFFAAILGICLIGRWSVPNALLNAPSVDPRNADTLRMFRPGWYFREYFRRRR
jgi:hypothetical protein